MNYNKISNEGNKERGQRMNIETIGSNVGANKVIDHIPSGETEIEKQLLDIPDKPKEPAKYIVVNCNRLNVREKPSMDSAILCVLNNSETMLVEDIVDGWAHVYTEFGIEGYIVEEYIKEV